MDPGTEDILDENEVGDVGNETLDEDQVEEVVSGGVDLVTAEDVSPKTKLRLKSSNILNNDDDSELDQETKEVLAGFAEKAIEVKSDDEAL